MADIALVFHWPPDHLDRMSIAELGRWRAKAAARQNAEDA
jgi:hypothetical protein